jgi:hypothetical protein
MRGDSRGGSRDYSQANAKEYRRLRELLKARLWAQRVGAPDEYLSDNPKPLPAGYKTPEALAQYEPFLPEAVRRAGERADELVRSQQPHDRRRAGSAVNPPVRACEANDADSLRAEAERHLREEARLRGIIDGLQRRADAHGRAALDLEERARLAEAAQTVVPLASQKRWGHTTIVGSPSDTEVERSADPDAVEREATARTRDKHTRPAAQKRTARGAEADARVRERWPLVKAELQSGGRKTTEEEIERVIAERLTGEGFRISPRTVRLHKPDKT